MDASQTQAALPKVDCSQPPFHRELTRILYQNLSKGLLGTLFVAALLSFGLMSTAPVVPLWVWFGGVCLVCLLRKVAQVQYLKSANVDWPGWRLIFSAGALASALLWGLANGLFFASATNLQQSLLLMVACGVSAGAIAVLTPSLVLCVCFAVLTIFPLGFQYLAVDTAGFRALGLMSFIYCGFILMVARTYHSMLLHSLELRQKQESLIDELKASSEQTEAVNAKLVGEIERRSLAEALSVEAKENAESASAAKSAFLATMSHEIRTPLNGIIGMLQVMSDSKMDREQKDYLEVISGSADTLLSILDDVLDISKIESGRLEMEHITYDLDATLRASVQLMRQRAQQKHIQLVLDCDKSVPRWVQGDPTRLRQVLINLLSNSIKFTQIGRVRLHVSVMRANEHHYDLRILCEDTGIGMPEEMLPCLFDTYRQGDRSTTRHFGGSGLGLSICKRLARMMRGDLIAASHPGKGTTMCLYVRLDVVDEAARRKAEKDSYRICDAASQPRFQGHVLVAEDNSVNQRVAMLLLNRLGLEVSLAADGVEAVAMTQASSFDLVFMDYQMPNMDGMEATREIRNWEASQRDCEPLTIVALTAAAAATERKQCFECGMNDVLTKPLRQGELEMVLQQWLPESSAQKPTSQVRT